MALTPRTSHQGSTREKMSAGQHPAALAFIKQDVDEYQGKSRDVYVWRWEHTKKTDAEGQPLVIWCRTNDSYGYAQASLTQLLNQIFGPELSEEEVQQMDLELLVGKIRGYVLVQNGTNGKGEPIVKWGGYVHPEGRPYPDPATFFANPGGGDPDFEETPAPPPVRTPQRESTSPPVRQRQPMPKATAEVEIDDLEDPFK